LSVCGSSAARSDDDLVAQQVDIARTAFVRVRELVSVAKIELELWNGF
jgi:hypothetical protein